MVTREFLKKEGFALSTCSPASVEEYEKKTRNGYISVRFTGSEIATGLFAYSQSYDHKNTRKVVLNDTTVTEEDYQMTVKICRL